MIKGFAALVFDRAIRFVEVGFFVDIFESGIGDGDFFVPVFGSGVEILELVEAFFVADLGFGPGKSAREVAVIAEDAEGFDSGYLGLDLFFG